MRLLPGVLDPRLGLRHQAGPERSRTCDLGDARAALAALCRDWLLLPQLLLCGAVHRLAAPTSFVDPPGPDPMRGGLVGPSPGPAPPGGVSGEFPSGSLGGFSGGSEGHTPCPLEASGANAVPMGARRRTISTGNGGGGGVGAVGGRSPGGGGEGGAGWGVEQGTGLGIGASEGFLGGGEFLVGSEAPREAGAGVCPAERWNALAEMVSWITERAVLAEPTEGRKKKVMPLS